MTPVGWMTDFFVDCYQQAIDFKKSFLYDQERIKEAYF